MLLKSVGDQQEFLPPHGTEADLDRVIHMGSFTQFPSIDSDTYNATEVSFKNHPKLALVTSGDVAMNSLCPSQARSGLVSFRRGGHNSKKKTGLTTKLRYSYWILNPTGI